MKKLVVVVKIEDQLYSFDAEKIQVIDRVPKIIPLPYSDHRIVGIANIRGEVLPVLSFRKMLKLEHSIKPTRVLIFNENNIKFGLLVDLVEEIVDVGNFEEVEVKGEQKENYFIDKIFKNNEKILFFVNTEKITDTIFSKDKIETEDTAFVSRKKIKEKEKVRFEKFITFKVGDEEYCFELLNVNEIIKIKKITALPDNSGLIKGIISLRDVIIPVIDFKKYLTDQKSEINEKARVIIIQVDNTYVGLLVDEVREVLSIDKEKVQPAPEIMSDRFKKFIKGIINIDNGERLIILLDNKEIFTEDFRKNLVDITQEKNKKVDEINKNVEKTKAEKFLIFSINNQYFGINILSIIEINRISKITPVFELPDFIMGFMNLRGEVLPVVDTKKLFFNMESKLTGNSRVVIMGSENGGEIAFLVDYIKEVINVLESQLDSSYFKAIDIKSKFFKEVIKEYDENEIVIVLNEKVLSNIVEESENLKSEISKFLNKSNNITKD